MDIFFQDPSVIPLPPGEVRIMELNAEPWSDGRRVRVYLKITPFQKRPDGEISILNAAGEELAHASIIETMVADMEFTLHLRSANIVGPFTVTAFISYTDRSENPAGHEDEPETMIVDRATVQFDLAG